MAVTPARMVVLDGEYRRVLAEMKRIRDRNSGAAQWPTADRDRLAALKKRRDELQALLGMTA